jgi:murein DD-endopeptidase MepM/ murein hydrolase activator NlpD
MNMNIILFTSKRGQIWSFEIRVLRTGVAVAAIIALLCGALFYSGFRTGEDQLAWLDDWRNEIRRQQTEIASARDTAQINLDALALRIGQMQAQLLRLNAVGERLVQQAGLDVDEFDFNAIPAVGGPHDIAGVQSTRVPDFLNMLDELDSEMGDREQKLSVLETLLMDRSLLERVMPSGRPVTSGWLSSKFGKRADPITGKHEYHKGVDFATEAGADVISVGDGIVTWSGKRSGYGNLVEISHGNGYSTRYGHNRKLLVGIGDTVKKGQLIAEVGSTGRSTGPHVHFEVLHNGQAVNPAKYVSN